MCLLKKKGRSVVGGFACRPHASGVRALLFMRLLKKSGRSVVGGLAMRSGVWCDGGRAGQGGTIVRLVRRVVAGCGARIHKVAEQAVVLFRRAGAGAGCSTHQSSTVSVLQW